MSFERNKFESVFEREEYLKKAHDAYLRIHYKPEIREDPISEVITPDRLTELFGQRGRLEIQTIARKLLIKKKKKLAVSLAEFPFSTEPKLLLFEVEKPKSKQESIPIIFLGKGKTDKIPEIANETAAESLGFKVLVLNRKRQEKYWLKERKNAL